MPHTALLAGLAALAPASLVAYRLWRRRPAAGRDDSAPSSRPPRAAEAPARPTFHEAETRFVEMPRSQPYQLLNSAEQVLYQRLVEAMPNMIVCPQVGLALLAQLRGRQAQAEARTMLGRSVDFVVCREDFSILAAIELSWPAPEDPRRQAAEAAKREALEKLGLPLIVFRPNDLPDADAISREIAGAIVRRNQLESRRNGEAR